MRRKKPLPAPILVTLVVVTFFSVLVTILFDSFPGSRQSPGNGTSGPGESSGQESGSYTLQFGTDFNPVLASRDDLGISIVLALDVSGSMSDLPVSDKGVSGASPKYVQAAEALLEVTGVLERLLASMPQDQVIKVGLITFNETARPLLPLTLLDKAGIAGLKAVAMDEERFAPGGKTAIGQAIELGARWLAQSGTILRSLVIITDGENTAGTDPEKVIQALYANRNSASGEGYLVSTSTTLLSFVGFDIGSEYFRNFATLGARIASAADKAQLAATLSSILEADITKLEAPDLATGAGSFPAAGSVKGSSTSSGSGKPSGRPADKGSAK